MPAPGMMKRVETIAKHKHNATRLFLHEQRCFGAVDFSFDMFTPPESFKDLSPEQRARWNSFQATFGYFRQPTPDRQASLSKPAPSKTGIRKAGIILSLIRVRNKIVNEAEQINETGIKSL
jgi:hypothetical protein